jgi:hypothetical protein
MSTQNPTWPEPPDGSVVRVTYTRLSYAPDAPAEQTTLVAERTQPSTYDPAARWYAIGTDDPPYSWEELLATTTTGGTALIASVDRVEVAEWRPWEAS